MRRLGVSQDELAGMVAREQAAVGRRVVAYGRPAPEVAGRAAGWAYRELLTPKGTPR